MVTQPPPSGGALDRPSTVALGASFALGASLRAWLCVFDDGIYWPDEIFQSLEPAHRLVFGYGLIPWEFREGARNWTFPALVAAALRLVTWIVGESPRHYLIAMRLVFAALSMLTAWGVYRLGRTLGASPVGAALGGALFALAPPAIYFAPRALSESGSAVAMVFGLAIALRAGAPRRAVALGASLLGLAVLIRIQNGIFCAALIAILLARRRWREAALAAAVLAGWAFLYGLIDRLTWGEWFHAAIAYLRANIVENKGAQWGVSESTYYLRVLWTSTPLIASLALPLALAAGRRATGLLLTVAVDLVLLSRVGHKEYRFALPLLPLWFALAGVGYSVLAARLERFSVDPRWAAGTIALCAALAGVRFHELTFGDLGQYEDLKPTASAYDDFGALNRLLLVAHERRDICGLLMDASHLAWTGGYTYLHRHVPVYSRGDWRDALHFNYVLTYGRPANGRVVASEGPLALVNLGPSCQPDPGYNWWLP